MKQELLLQEIKIHRENSFKIIYKQYYGLVENHVLRNSGNVNDAKDLFQEVMLVLAEKLERDDFVLTAKLKTYVLAIAKNLWLKSLRNTSKQEVFERKHDKYFYEEMQLSIEKEMSYSQRLKRLFTKMTAHCSRLLDDIYYKAKSILQIQQEYGYSTKHNAQNQKHKCIEQLRNLKDQE